MEKLNPTKHKVYEDENNYFVSKGICNSKVLKLRGFIFKQEVLRISCLDRREQEFIAFKRCRMESVWVDIWQVSSVLVCRRDFRADSLTK